MVCGQVIVGLYEPSAYGGDRKLASAGLLMSCFRVYGRDATRCSPYRRTLMYLMAPNSGGLLTDIVSRTVMTLVIVKMIVSSSQNLLLTLQISMQLNV